MQVEFDDGRGMSMVHPWVASDRPGWVGLVAKFSVLGGSGRVGFRVKNI